MKTPKAKKIFWNKLSHTQRMAYLWEGGLRGNADALRTAAKLRGEKMGPKLRAIALKGSRRLKNKLVEDTGNGGWTVHENPLNKSEVKKIIEDIRQYNDLAKMADKGKRAYWRAKALALAKVLSEFSESAPARRAGWKLSGKLLSNPAKKWREGQVTKHTCPKCRSVKLHIIMRGVGGDTDRPWFFCHACGFQKKATSR